MWQRNSTYRRWLCITKVLKGRHFRRDSQRCSLYLRWLPLAKDGELEHHKENELASKTTKRGGIWTWAGYPKYIFARIVIALKANKCGCRLLTLSSGRHSGSLYIHLFRQSHHRRWICDYYMNTIGFMTVFYCCLKHASACALATDSVFLMYVCVRLLLNMQNKQYIDLT